MRQQLFVLRVSLLSISSLAGASWHNGSISMVSDDQPKHFQQHLATWPPATWNLKYKNYRSLVRLDWSHCNSLLIVYHSYSFCMDHCKKLGGRSPPLRTKTEWENLLREMKAVSPDPRRLPTKIWLSATEGDVGLGEQLDHGPEGTEAV